MLKNPTCTTYMLFSEIAEEQHVCQSVAYKIRDGDCNPKLYMATLSAFEAVASLIPCTVHDGVQWQ